MSDWTLHKDRPKTSALHDVATVLLTHANLSTRQLHALISHHQIPAVTKALQRLKSFGLAIGTRMASPAGRGSRLTMHWTATKRLHERMATGETLVLPRHYVDFVDELKEEAWEPKPYINPIRARALGRAA